MKIQKIFGWGSKYIQQICNLFYKINGREGVEVLGRGGGDNSCAFKINEPITLTWTLLNKVAQACEGLKWQLMICHQQEYSVI